MQSTISTGQGTRPYFKLHHALRHRTVAERETAVERGIMKLAILQNILSRNQSSGYYGISQWKEQIANAVKQANRKKAIIGVVGNTGAGKTSLINAILGEGQLLPTNCMRACTATITEITYSDSGIPYVADIEYVSAPEWRKELELGWEILFDQNGKIVRDATNQDSDAGVFYSKMKAVYTDLTREKLQATTIDQLMHHPSLSVLGHVERVEENSATSFATRLQSIIDSNEHTDENDARNTANKQRANWPLIRRARIAVKSAALQTGVTLVDLPGVQDSNAARAKIATNYLMECSGLLVAAPIHRAVDDKVAKNLLGKSFKRQVMMDGGFNTVTFVCTKADDISITESARSPAIAPLITKLMHEADQVRIAITHLKEEVDKYEVLKKETETDLHATYDRQDLMESGKAEGATQLSFYLDERKRLQKRVQEISEQLRSINAELDQKESRLMEIESGKVATCVRERNDYVEKALKRDFVTGVKEFDQEQAGRGDKDQDYDYDAAIEHRDYDKLYDALPVFCVSSKAFQKALGHLEHEPNIVGFEDVESSGIPTLQDHCKQLTDAGRSKSADFFLAMFSALLNSLSLFVTIKIDGIVLSDEQRAMLKVRLEEKLGGLKYKLQRIVKDVCTEVRERLKTHLYAVFEPAHTNAGREANTIANGWNQLAHQTWRAVCVRQGAFNNGNGKYDWNEDLVGPILDLVAPKWETTFNDLLQSTFHKFSISCRKAVKDFHRAIPHIFEVLGLGSQIPSSHTQLGTQLDAYKNAFEFVEDSGKDFINSQQRQISRAFKPVIRDSMAAAYRQCLCETGSGSWARMKDHMATHIANHPGMFRESTRVVQIQLDDLLKSLREKLLEHITSVHDTIFRDYTTTLVGPEGNSEEESSPLTGELLGFLNETALSFDRLVVQLDAGVPLDQINATNNVMEGEDAYSDGRQDDMADYNDGIYNDEISEHMEIDSREQNKELEANEGYAPSSSGHDIPFGDGDSLFID